MAGLRQPGRGRELITTTASLTLTNQDVGKTVCNVDAAGAVTVTLPNPSTCDPGSDILVLSCADQNLIASCDEKLITFNNVAADSVALQTASEKAGGGFLFTCVGASWHCLPMVTEAQTITVGTD